MSRENPSGLNQENKTKYSIKFQLLLLSVSFVGAFLFSVLLEMNAINQTVGEMVATGFIIGMMASMGYILLIGLKKLKKGLRKLFNS